MIHRIRHSLIGSTNRNQRNKKRFKWGTNVAVICSLALMSYLAINTFSFAPLYNLGEASTNVNGRLFMFGEISRRAKLDVRKVIPKEKEERNNALNDFARKEIEDDSTISRPREERQPHQGKEHRTNANTIKSIKTTTRQKSSPKFPPITRVSLLGERNSGTNWMYDELRRCFDGTSLTVKRTLTRYKHWFQDEKVATDRNETIVIAMFRDPYYWVDAMRRKPHHATDHIHLGWKEFVTKPWTMERVGKDLSIDESNTTNVICQEKFRYHQIVSCHKRPYPDGHFGPNRIWSQHQPFYEMQYDTGEPYGDLLDLRRDKILNLLDTAEYSFVRDRLIVNYERLVRDGTGDVIRHVEDATGVRARCESSPPQEKRFVRRLDADFVSWLTKHIDWETEALIGYEKWKVEKSLF